MKNVQISFDENLLEEVDRFAASERISRSAIVRKALKHWIKEKEIKEFENDWIRSLQETPDDSTELEPWVQVQKWEEA
jgi:CopG family transcriptional regulator / antitoxin EndoAI